MRFVHVEDYIHPDAGYQVNMVSKIQVEQGHEVFIVTAEMDKMPDYLTSFFGKENITERDQLFFEKTGVKIIRVPIIAYYSGRAIFHSRVFRIVKDLKPDAVLVHGEDTMTGMQFIWKAKKLPYPLVLDCHMLEMASQHPLSRQFQWFFRHFVTPIIIKNKIPLFRVVDSDFVQKCYNIPLNKTELCPLGTDTNYFRADNSRKSEYRSKYGIDNSDFVVIYAGKLDQTKDGKLLATAVQKKFRTEKNVTTVVIGKTTGKYGEEVEEILSSSENRILRFRTQTYMDLQIFYQMADIAIFAKQCSMSFMEMQSCELPVCFEDNEINRIRSTSGNAVVFTPGDVQDFRSKIESLINLPESDFLVMKKSARKYVCDNFNIVPVVDKISQIMIDEAVKFKLKILNQ